MIQGHSKNRNRRRSSPSSSGSNCLPRSPGALFKNCSLERGEIEVQIPLHELDAAGKTARGKKVVRVEEDDELGAAFPDADVAAHIGAGCFARAPEVANPRISCARAW